MVRASTHPRTIAKTQMMTADLFSKLDESHTSAGPAEAIDGLIALLREQRDYHKLFDALLMKTKFEMNLPLGHPTSFDDVPTDEQSGFEERYVAAAREVGDLLLVDGDLQQAWMYFRTIREPERIAEAIENLEVSADADERTEGIINIALYEGAHPVKGLEIMLQTHGTCNTITALDQQMHQLQPQQRRASAALLVRQLYRDLCQTVAHEIERKEDAAPQHASLAELLEGRDWLFDEGNYHIDVSHLNSVVRFARFLEQSDTELRQVAELADYGGKLDRQFQYPSDPPFDDFYPAHRAYFRVIADDGRDAGLDYFRNKLAAPDEEQDQPMLAYVLVDLLTRVGRLDEALQTAQQHLQDVEEQGFSFGQLCRQAGRLDVLREAARQRGDAVTYTAALIEENGDAAAR